MFKGNGTTKREFLKWFCRITGGYLTFSLAPPMKRINTTLFSEAKAQGACGQDICSTYDHPDSTCEQRDICGSDSSGHCKNDECQQDESGACENDYCQVDKSQTCENDTCQEDKSGACNSDTCQEDESGGCTSDKCTSDRSGSCASDNCESDKSGACVSDQCEGDSSGACVSDQCASDKSGVCKTDRCLADKSGECESDSCRSDKSQSCQGDQCVSDKSGSCKSDRCISDSSGLCQSDRCNTDKSGACISDQCKADSSSACVNDDCTEDQSGLCQSDTCETDESAPCHTDQCGIDTGQCPSDTSCVLDGFCLDDGTCFGDLCLDDGGCFIDIVLESGKTRRDLMTGSLNRALKWLYKVSVVTLILSAWMAPHEGRAAVFTVPTGDAAALIAAINTANVNGEADTINLGAGIYTLTQENADSYGAGLPSITSDITINGSASGTTIIERSVSAPPFRIIHVAPGGNLALNRLIIRRGVANTVGGGIFNEEGTLTLNRCTVTGNTVTDEGEGSAGGGGIGNFSGTVTLLNSTISNNTSQTPSGGDSVGAGVENLFGEGFTITNTTIYGNSASGDYLAAGSGVGSLSSNPVSITNATISGNSCQASDPEEGIAIGGGIYGAASVLNTIIAMNTAADGPDLSGSVESRGHNLFGSLTGSSTVLGSGDLTGIPGLGSFIDNGTPGNGRLPLLAGSQAINTGDPGECSTNPLLATDQLGQARVGICDIGAVEFLQQIISGAAAIPIVGGWGLVILTCLLGGSTFAILRKRRRA